MIIQARLLIIFMLSIVFGCNDMSKDEDAYVYFGGEIINPNNDYVILSSPDETSDTLYLNDQNRFIIKLTDFKPGLYTFIHGENQRVLLEANDSIMVRLNTVDFDESLVFTGNGARKNNFLISAYLENEDDNKRVMRNMWDMEPTIFETTLNKDRDRKLKALKEFTFEKEYSDLFKSIAESNINYDYYYYKELYPFSYYGYNNLIHYKDLPEDFYNYRSKVDYNNEDLIGLFPYTKFLFNHFNNLALEKYYENASHNVIFDKKSAVYNLEKLRLMDSLISNPTIKNHLLKFTARDFILLSEDSSEIKEVYKSYAEKSTDAEDKTYIKTLVESVGKLKPGNALPYINLLAFDNSQTALSDLIKKPTVVYFWSSNLPVLLRNSHYKVNLLKAKYPNVTFLAININDDDIEHWKGLFTKYRLDTDNEYHFVNPTEAMNQLAISSVNRSILLDADGKIINSNALLFASEFEEQLDLLTHKK